MRKYPVIAFVFLIALFVSNTVVGAYPMPEPVGEGELETRGIWLTPGYFVEEPEDAIRAVNTIADAGFNVIFLEMNRTNGYAQYESDLVPVLEPFDKFDPADIIIEHAKKRDLEVHAYFHTLNNPYLVKENPDWAMERVDKDAKKLVVNGSNEFPISSENSARGSNQLIMYTSEFGETTGTNEFGTEVTIEDDIVVKVETSVGDTDIPENGYVLSGHGTSRTWLEMNIQIGDEITIEKDDNTLVSSSSWLEPGNEEVVAELKKHVHEIITKYDVDGFHFDHVRYPPTDGMVELIFDYILEGKQPRWSTDVYGYSEENQQRFMEEYGKNPLDITVDDDELFIDWWEFRSDNITNLVTSLSEYARSLDDDLVMSAALTVRPAYDDWDVMYSGVDYRKLSYPLDVIIPMAYHLNAGEAEFLFPGNREMWIYHVTQGALDNIEGRALLYTGIGGTSTSHEQWTPHEWNNTIEIARSAMANGTSAFEYIVLGHMEEDITNFEALKNGVYKTPAKPMHSVPEILEQVRIYSGNE